MKITKRDGRKVEFDKSKIEQAVVKAALAEQMDDISANNLGKRIAQSVAKSLENEGKAFVDIESVQDEVEEALMQKHPSIAKAYILYRHKKAKLRRVKAGAGVALIEDYLGGQEWRIRENSNMAFSLQGLNNHIASDITAEYWLNSVYDERIRNAHISGDMHICDLSQLSSYCVGWDIQDLLRVGFTGVPGKTSSSPAKHFGSILGQIVNFLYSLQGESAGAQAVSSFDTLLAPFIKSDGLNYDQVKQEIQTFVFNMNVPTRVGFQSPFSNITLDLVCPSTLKDVPVIIGGIDQNTTYGEYQNEMDMINRAFAEVMFEGDAAGRCFRFPIPTVNIHKNFDWDSKRADEIFKLSGRYGTYYYSNFLNSDLNPEDARSMCPMHPDTKVLVRSNRGIIHRRIQDIYDTTKRCGTKYEVRYKGEWIPAEATKISSQKCVRLLLVNGTEVIFDERHEQPVLSSKDGEMLIKVAGEIKAGEFLPFNISGNGKEYHDHRYRVGRIVGAYLGDGSYAKNAGIFSLNKTTKSEILEEIKDFFESFGFTTTIRETPDTQLRSLYVKGMGASFKAWMSQFISGEYADTKRLTAYCFALGESFCKGLLDGWYETDGGNSGGIYTINEGLKEDFSTLCGFIGYGYDVSGKDTRGSGYKSDTVVYVLKFHKRESYGEFFFRKFGLHWVQVKEVIEDSYAGNVYCMAVNSDEHLFELANGLVTHNCRLRLDNRELRKRGGGLFGANPLTGSIGVVTLNLPRIGYDSKDEQEFFVKLESLMEVAKDSLCMKRETVEAFTEAGLYPYTKFYLRAVKERFGRYWANHFSTIGLVGMNEACLNLFGEDISTEKGKSFAERVLTFMRGMIMKYQEETGDYFNLEASPAEGTSYRLALLDKRSRPGMIFANGKAEEGKEVYYTNSTQLPVGYTDDLFKALDHQETLQTLYNGGTVVHGLIGEEIKDAQTVKQLVKTIAENYKIPYFTITPTFSVCSDHGYIAGEVYSCPTCGKTTEVYSRVVGYYSPVSNWNAGKAQEFKDRKEYVLIDE